MIIQAASSGDRSAIYYLFVVVFASARAAVRCLTEHYNAHPRQRTFETYARLKYCANRIQAIFYTLRHAPERFLKSAQLRALTRARAVLAHIWQQPVDFSPLTPFLTSPENCPPPPRSVGAPASCRHEPCHTPNSAPAASSADASSPEPSSSPRSALRTSSLDPLLLPSPGCALASVLLQLAAIYGLSNTPAPAPRPGTSASASSAITPSASLSPLSSSSGVLPASSSPCSDLGTPHVASPLHSPP